MPVTRSGHAIEILGGYNHEFSISAASPLTASAGIRNMVRETVLNVQDLVQPIFVAYGTNVKKEISSMPGVYHFSLDMLKGEVDNIVALGIPAVLLFGIPETKDSIGSSGFADDGIVQEATRLIKGWYPELLVVADTCLCEFTDHGHCGMVHTFEHEGHICGDVLNDESLVLLVKTAVSQAKAGADIIAPSNMMDGFVRAIREGLDEAGYQNIPIMSYSVKYASAFYGLSVKRRILHLNLVTVKPIKWTPLMQEKRLEKQNLTCLRVLICLW